MGDLIYERNYTVTDGNGATYHVLLQMDEAKLEYAARQLARKALESNNGTRASMAYGALQVSVTKVLR